MNTWCFAQFLFVNSYVVLILFQIAAEFRVVVTLASFYTDHSRGHRQNLSAAEENGFVLFSVSVLVTVFS